MDTNLCTLLRTVKNIYVSSSDVRKGLEFALIWSLDIGIIIIRSQPIPSHFSLPPKHDNKAMTGD